MDMSPHEAAVLQTIWGSRGGVGPSFADSLDPVHREAFESLMAKGMVERGYTVKLEVRFSLGSLELLGEEGLSEPGVQPMRVLELGDDFQPKPGDDTFEGRRGPDPAL